MGKGGWGRTGLREVLPVTCLDFEDLVENTEGFTVKLSSEKTPLSKIDFSGLPPILGYNQTLLRDGFDVLLEVKETGDFTNLGILWKGEGNGLHVRSGTSLGM